MHSPATTIDEVLERLDHIIDTASANNDPIGYFAYVYRRTTAAVKEAIDADRFQDAARMRAFDVAFANLYLEAYDRYCGENDCSAAWRLAFERARERRCVLQHVLLGMNAHINLDLGVAAARVMSDRELAALEADFYLVNDILQEIIDDLQDRLARINPLFKVVDYLGRRRDERMLDAGMRTAREQAWTVAHQVWEAREEGLTIVGRVDTNVARLGERLCRSQSRLERWLWWLLGLGERGDVGRNLARLRSDPQIGQATP